MHPSLTNPVVHLLPSRLILVCSYKKECPSKPHVPKICLVLSQFRQSTVNICCFDMTSQFPTIYLALIHAQSLTRKTELTFDIDPRTVVHLLLSDPSFIYIIYMKLATIQ